MQRRLIRWRESWFYFRQLRMEYLIIKWRYLKRSLAASRDLLRLRIILLWFAVIGIISYLILVYGYRVEWTGFSDFTAPDGSFQRGKTLWDWMELLIVPAALAFGASILARSDRTGERELAIDQQREEALQTYFDRMTALLLEADLSDSDEDSGIRNLARSRTLATLRGLNGYRKGVVIRFLYEVGLIDGDGSIISLNRADLSSADLFGLYLRRANFHAVDLDKANLSYAHLTQADLSGSKITNADLENADLIEAQMEYALLQKSDLFHANLSRARLGTSDFEGADLGSADLTNAAIFRTNLTGCQP